MKAIEFPEQTSVLAENQDEYQSLPVFQDKQETISCYKLDWSEVIKLLFTRTLWLRQCHFGAPLQPQAPTVNYPFLRNKTESPNA